MRTSRIVAVSLSTMAAGAVFATATPSPAFACHTNPGGQEDDVCIAVDSCHILVVHDLDNGIAGLRYDPPQVGQGCLPPPTNPNP